MTDAPDSTPHERTDGSPEEPAPFSEGPPPLPRPMLVLDGEVPDLPDTPAAEPVDHGTCRCGGAFDADGYCTSCGEPRPDPRHHFTAHPLPELAAVCDRGVRHADNEDAMAVWGERAPDGPDLRAALVVCDGVSSATRSAEASLAAAYAALEVLSTSGLPPQERLLTATDAAAEAVARVGEEFPDSAPSCTFVAAVVEGRTATVGNVGDSRAYWMPDLGQPHRLTRDDSMAEEQVAAGLDRSVAESGPLSHTITRWLGPDAPDHTPRITTVDVSAPGWLLLCSDGLWNYASEPVALHDVVVAEQERVGTDPLGLAEALVGWAVSRGGADNITVALLRTGDGDGPTEVGHTAYPDSVPEGTGPTEMNPADRAGQDGTHG